MPNIFVEYHAAQDSLELLFKAFAVYYQDEPHVLTLTLKKTRGLENPFYKKIYIDSKKIYEGFNGISKGWLRKFFDEQNDEKRYYSESSLKNFELLIEFYQNGNLEKIDSPDDVNSISLPDEESPIKELSDPFKKANIFFYLDFLMACIISAFLCLNTPNSNIPLFEPIFDNTDGTYKVLILPFNKTSGGQDIGSIVAEKMEEIALDMNYPISVKYADLEENACNFHVMDSIRIHHNADHLIYKNEMENSDHLNSEYICNIKALSYLDFLKKTAKTSFLPDSVVDCLNQLIPLSTVSNSEFTGNYKDIINWNLSLALYQTEQYEESLKRMLDCNVHERKEQYNYSIMLARNYFQLDSICESIDYYSIAKQKKRTSELICESESFTLSLYARQHQWIKSYEDLKGMGASVWSKKIVEGNFGPLATATVSEIIMKPDENFESSPDLCPYTFNFKNFDNVLETDRNYYLAWINQAIIYKHFGWGKGTGEFQKSLSNILPFEKNINRKLVLMNFLLEEYLNLALFEEYEKLAIQVYGISNESFRPQKLLDLSEQFNLYTDKADKRDSITAKCIQYALKLDSSFIPAILMRGMRKYYHFNDQFGALKDFLFVMENDSSQIEAYRLAADILTMNFYPEKAIEVVNKGLKYHPDDYELKDLKNWALISMGVHDNIIVE